MNSAVNLRQSHPSPDITSDAINILTALPHYLVKHLALLLPTLASFSRGQTSRELHTHRDPLNSPLSGTTRVSRYQKGNTNLDFTEASGSGISWAVCKSAPRSRQITTPAPHHSIFTGRLPFLPHNQQRQSTEGSRELISKY